ncbi:MAG TPA: YihY/virulence factor BrkB family protein [Candidatus Dormibacteraeota bacterium]|nr:YihY/virulence factor BrkB family protein [Candidatus Dormibacteraeota bacterium]
MAAVPKVAGLNWKELLGSIWQETAQNDVVNRAAQLAFWFLLGFFPMLLSVTSIASMVGSAPPSQGMVIKYVGAVLPPTASTLVGQVLAQTAGGGRAWFSLLLGLWSSSSATTGLIDALNAIYELKESRPWWKSRLIALTLAIAMGVLLTAALIVVMYGPALLLHIAPSSAGFYVWEIAQWPAAALLLVLALLGLYRFAPNFPEQKWKWLLPGSIVAAAIWIAVSVLFKVYVRHFSDFGLLYGSLGTLVILMFWFYLSGAAILVGGEINATLEKAAVKHKAPGAKKRGQRSLAQMHD